MTTDQIDQFYADINAVVVESVHAFERDAMSTVIEPDIAPDPEFANLAVPALIEALDEWAAEEQAEQWQREQMRWGRY